MRKSVLLAAFWLIAMTGGTALALNEKNEGRAGQPRALNAGDDEIIRERERMRQEYRALREQRFTELKESEALATGRSSAAVPGWRTGSDRVAMDDGGPASMDELTPEKLMPGQTAMVNVFLGVCGVGLTVLLVVRLRKGAAMRRRRKGFRQKDGPMTLSLNSIGTRKFGGGANAYQGHLTVTNEVMPPKEPTPEVSR